VTQRTRRLRVIAAWVLLIGAIVGWPLSALTVASTEPPFVLGLSWLAIILESSSLLTSSQVHEEQGEQHDSDEHDNQKG
jgi:uncharacterized membrane protein YfcA